jgi:pimeloyl-ACP methyl ester carboxylesterase
MPIAYKEYGKDTHNNHVLFVHGLGASSISWKDIPYTLSNYFHTITVDLIGFGESEKPEQADYTVKGLSKFIFDFITWGPLSMRFLDNIRFSNSWLYKMPIILYKTGQGKAPIWRE